MSGALSGINAGLGAVNRLVSTTGSVVNDVARIGQLTGGALGADLSGLSFAGGSWADQLQPGSWRGVPFVLDAGDTAAGRRVAIHEYAYRDEVWPEDLGKLPRRFAVQAFIVGDDCYQLRDQMLRACEIAGAGTLVHPTLGSIEVVLLEFKCTDRRERGRVVEFDFAFIVAGDVRYPATATATKEAIGSAADALTTASTGDLGSALQAVTGTIHQATAFVGQYTAIARTVVGDASRIFNAVRGVAGFWGRFSTGRRSTMQSPLATVQSALGLATTARSTVNNAATLVDHLAGFL
jgi:prophage DNA circulation protein